MGDTVRITDLVAPVLTAEQQAVREATERRPVTLAADELVARARASTGLRDLGDLGGRLEAHLAAIDADTGLTNLGRLVLRQRVQRLLENRLRLHDLLARNPQISEIELPAPVVVVGLPRSGTTHLVNLLAQDPRRRALPFWESQEPMPIPGEGPGVDGVDPRHARWQAVHDMEAVMAPLTSLMHDRFPAAIEEEVELLDLDFASYTLEWHARVPSWRDHYLQLDHVAHYRYLRTVLQALTFLRGPRHWVLKSPQHLEQLGPLMATFPDAMVVFTHRDPVAVIQSAITMLAYGDRMRRYTIEPDQLAAYWVDRIETLLRAGVRDRDLVAPERSVDVYFDAFMGDQLGTVAGIYRHAGLELPDAVRAQFVRYLDEHPRGARGSVGYDLRGDFGLDPAAVRARFDFYLDRFPVRTEA